MLRANRYCSVIQIPKDDHCVDRIFSLLPLASFDRWRGGLRDADPRAGQSTDKVCARYGRDLSAQKVRSFVERVRPSLKPSCSWQFERCG